MRTTSVALGDYFESFIKAKIAQGRYNNASEVIRACKMPSPKDSTAASRKVSIPSGICSI